VKNEKPAPPSSPPAQTLTPPLAISLPPRPDYVTRAEFHQGLDNLRDLIDARFLNLSEKIENLTSSIQQRLTQNESAIARLDERTKCLTTDSNHNNHN
jgi:hypothetical protein